MKVEGKVEAHERVGHADALSVAARVLAAVRVDRQLVKASGKGRAAELETDDLVVGAEASRGGVLKSVDASSRSRERSAAARAEADRRSRHGCHLACFRSPMSDSRSVVSPTQCQPPEAGEVREKAVVARDK
jgi:hypothetical protein